MSSITADRVLETTSSSGTGAVTLAGAQTGYQSFNAAFGVGPSFFYCISAVGSLDWEVGEGHLTDAVTLSRDSLLASSTGGFVNFGATAKDIYATYSGKRAVSWSSAAGTGFIKPDGTVLTPAASVGTNTVQVSNGSGGFSSFSTFTYDNPNNALGVQNITGTALAMVIKPMVPAVTDDAGTLTLAGQPATATTKAGGSVAITAGAGSGTGAPGAVAITAGGSNEGGAITLAAGAAALGTGGVITLTAGASGAGNAGGSFTLNTGVAGSGNASGGSATIITANGSGTFAGGNFVVSCGTGGPSAGQGGAVIINGGAAGAGGLMGNIIFRFPGSKNALRMFDSGVGTVALGFYGAAPVARATTAGAASTFVAGAGVAVQDVSTFDGYTIAQVVKALRNIGVLV